MARMTDFRRTLCCGLFLAGMAPAAALAGEQVGVLECHLSGNGHNGFDRESGAGLRLRRRNSGRRTPTLHRQTDQGRREYRSRNGTGAIWFGASSRRPTRSLRGR